MFDCCKLSPCRLFCVTGTELLHGLVALSTFPPWIIFSFWQLYTRIPVAVTLGLVMPDPSEPPKVYPSSTMLFGTGPDLTGRTTQPGGSTPPV